MKRSIYFMLIFLGCLGSFVSCTDEVISYQAELSAQQEKLVKTVRVGDVQYQIKYQPLAMQILRAQQGESTPIDAKQFAGHRYFNLRIQLTNGKDIAKNIDSKTLNQIQFHSQKKFYLKRGSERLPCVLYHVLPTGFQSRGVEMILVFQDPEVEFNDQSSQDLTFVFEDDLLSQQVIETTFLATDL